MKLIFENWRKNLNEKGVRMGEVENFKDSFGDVVANFMTDVINNQQIRYLEEVNIDRLVEEMTEAAAQVIVSKIKRLRYDKRDMPADPTPEYFAQHRGEYQQEHPIREDEK